MHYSRGFEHEWSPVAGANATSRATMFRWTENVGMPPFGPDIVVVIVVLLRLLRCCGLMGEWE